MLAFFLCTNQALCCTPSNTVLASNEIAMQTCLNFPRTRPVEEGYATKDGPQSVDGYVECIYNNTMKDGGIVNGCGWCSRNVGLRFLFVVWLFDWLFDSWYIRSPVVKLDGPRRSCWTTWCSNQFTVSCTSWQCSCSNNSIRTAIEWASLSSTHLQWGLEWKLFGLRAHKLDGKMWQWHGLAIILISIYDTHEFYKVSLISNTT